MLSRSAKHLYWLARYIERTENIARMIDVNLELILFIMEINSINGNLSIIFNRSQRSESTCNIFHFLCSYSQYPVEYSLYQYNIVTYLVTICIEYQRNWMTT